MKRNETLTRTRRGTEAPQKRYAKQEKPVTEDHVHVRVHNSELRRDRKHGCGHLGEGAGPERRMDVVGGRGVGS